METNLVFIQENGSFTTQPENSTTACPTSYAFVTFSDMHGMRDGNAKSQIRRHVRTLTNKNVEEANVANA